MKRQNKYSPISKPYTPKYVPAPVSPKKIEIKTLFTPEPISEFEKKRRTDLEARISERMNSGLSVFAGGLIAGMIIKNIGNNIGLDLIPEAVTVLNVSYILGGAYIANHQEDIKEKLMALRNFQCDYVFLVAGYMGICLR